MPRLNVPSLLINPNQVHPSHTNQSIVITPTGGIEDHFPKDHLDLSALPHVQPNVQIPTAPSLHIPSLNPLYFPDPPKKLSRSIVKHLINHVNNLKPYLPQLFRVALISVAVVILPLIGLPMLLGGLLPILAV